MVLENASSCYMRQTLWVVAVYQSWYGVWMAGMMPWKVNLMRAAAVPVSQVRCPLLQVAPGIKHQQYRFSCWRNTLYGCKPIGLNQNQKLRLSEDPLNFCAASALQNCRCFGNISDLLSWQSLFWLTYCFTKHRVTGKRSTGRTVSDC